MAKQGEADFSCGSCKIKRPQKICASKEGRGPAGCPTLSREDVLAEARKEFEKPEIHEFARQASIQEAECYANRRPGPYVMQPTKTRIVELCEFAKKMGYNRLGLAFCGGLATEGGIVEEILKSHGFEVVSVMCKAGRTSKDLLGLKESEKIHMGTDEPMCNPVFQAKLMNHEKTDFNVLLGLCIGHDSLFFKYAQAPTTVLAVKDRVTGHNPLAAVYLSNSYYRRIRDPEFASR